MSAKQKDEKSIFSAAMELKTPAERTAYLDRICGADLALKARIMALLQAHEDKDDFLQAILEDSDISLEEDLKEKPGTVIGRYKLLEKIGEGGMAVVYMAEQEEPILRKVALKIIKLGMDTKSVIARFEAERQALALMDHPNIAKVFDAGATETGRPYFVMELVKGVSITEYCDQNNLSTNERLALFIQVCNAVQHAHQKGIIHRDFKPSNVMVTQREGIPVPKVIDFGIAKATKQRLTEKTLFTRYAQMIGTPAYMSPEQAELSDLDVDTRTDIYSLGVLLYELLTGTTPFSEEELRKAGYLEMQRIICQEEPAKPSTKLTTLGEELTQIAEFRRTNPDLLAKLIRGDLDWIVMKSLEKDRARRYDTASELAAELERHLNNEPIRAAAPSVSYRVGKFIRRHRVGVVLSIMATTAVLLTIITLAISTAVVWKEQGRTQQALEREQKALGQETQARTEAERQTKIARAVADFLNNDLLASVTPARARGRQVTVREILDTASQKIEGRFKDEPLIEASVRQTLGKTYTELGEYAEAARHLEQVRQLHQEHLEPDHPSALQSMKSLGWLYINQGRYQEAEPLLLKSLEITKRVLGEEHPTTLTHMSELGVLYRNQHRYEKAEALYLKTVEIMKRVLGEQHLHTLNTMHNLATLYSDQELYQEAEMLYRKTLEIKQSRFGEEHPDTLRTMNNLALLYRKQGWYEESEALCLKTVEIMKRVLGEEHLDTLRSMSNLATLYGIQDQSQKAESLHRHVLEVSSRILGDEHPDTLASMNNLAITYHNQGRYQEAEPLYFKTVEIRKRVLGEEHPDTLLSLHNLADLYCHQGRYQEAEPLYLKTVEIRKRVLGKSHPDTLKDLNLMVALYEAWDKPEEAQKWRSNLSEAEAERAAVQVPKYAIAAAEALSGKPAPSFTLQDINGQQISLSDFRGKVVVLDFWATWCSPCVKAIPHLETLYMKYRDEGLVVIGLNNEPNQAKVKQFAEGWMSYIVLLNAKRQFAEYGIRVIPTLFYIDREGRVRYHETGFGEGREKEIENKIKKLLGPSPDGNGRRRSGGHQATAPSPVNASDISPTPTVELRWIPALDAVAHRVYFGADPQSLVLLAEVWNNNGVNSPKLEKQRWYCWRVDAIRSDGSVVEGELWSFSTGDLVGWWRFDETEGRTAADSSGRGNDGKLIGNPQWQPGRIDGALAFDGLDDYVSIKDTPDFDIAAEITVACWIKVTKFDKPWQAITAKGNLAWRIIRARDSRNIEFACTGVNVPNTVWGNIYGRSVVDDSKWHHLAGVYDGMRVCLYVDGVLDAFIEGTGEMNTNDDYVLIGANAGDAWRYWHGLIDDVRVYSYALSEAQVKEIYAGRGPGPNKKLPLE